ncbi:phosphate acyltransferase [Aliarcobacter trophiarum LMG 25534]|uniref:Phosphate acyltransferase n=1 Tax=Aliarcobacter trophiarum LMG 25534 TaxID=1032241 RepID=A0AAD0QJL5_9BACT|nr:phosphate acyltransferase PlsX [Aliarcobacter trophiarum]AXK48230.1 acyl phosphate synthase [Aliarcobacter trophiarum LMG 25534]RXI28496.1 phosphate acyltransferase [Aliarcobacter trophiarum]RXJ93095.1 phosphate acyltransferase [Aliarcobacter trophiarum LMG 25534]
MIKIAIDAMGGDFGPEPIIEGLILAIRNNNNFTAIAVGDKEQLSLLIPPAFNHRIEILDTKDVISMHDSATDALKRKESTIYRAIELVKEGKANAVVSAGHSGATMSLATLKIGRLKGVSRPAIATLMPTSENQNTLVLDVGANVDSDAKNLFQFAIMGQAYAQSVLRLDEPMIGLLSNGEEESKGNEVTKECYKLLSSAKVPNFAGNVEGADIFKGTVDVVVCDGFVGNILLKTAEGVADTIGKIIKKNLKRSLISIAGAVLMRKVFKSLKVRVDYAEYGGAPLLGVKAPVIISHGKSNPKAIKNAIFQAIISASSNLDSIIEQRLEKYTIKEDSIKKDTI